MKNNHTINYLRLYDDLKRQRESWLPVWKDLCAFVAPTRGFFDGDAPNKARRIDHKTLLDSSPSLAVEVLSAGMMSGLTSPARSWFDLSLSPREALHIAGAGAWLNEVKKTLEDTFAKTNIYSVLHGFYQEISVFGTAAFLLEEDWDKTLRARLFTAGEYCLGADGQGKINRFAREFFMTPRQVADAFGEDVLPEQLRGELSRESENVVRIIHLIIPNKNYNAQKKDNLHWAYKSVYLLTDGTLLRESGYREFPVIAARWDVKNNGDVYGRSPAWKCLGDVKMLQKMQKTKLVALDKSTNPPMMVSSNVQGEVNLLPGGITRFNGTTDAAVKPAYEVSPDLTALDHAIADVRENIRAQFFADVFVMLASQPVHNMTAAEVAERHQEKMLVLGPVLERLKNELLDPLIERTLHILVRQGRVPKAPRELCGLDVKINYISTIAQAQKAAGLTALLDGLKYAEQLAKVCPEVLGEIDYKRALTEGLERVGAEKVLLKE